MTEAGITTSAPVPARSRWKRTEIAWVRPRLVDEPERTEHWQRVNDDYNGYEIYAQRTGERIIPLVVLEPI